jgi:hypothetical protein
MPGVCLGDQVSGRLLRSLLQKRSLASLGRQFAKFLQQYFRLLVRWDGWLAMKQCAMSPGRFGHCRALKYANSPVARSVDKSGKDIVFQILPAMLTVVTCLAIFVKVAYVVL